MSEFEIIKGNRSESISHVYKVAKLNELWERQYRNAILIAMENNKDIKIMDYPQDELMKIALSGIKYVCSIRDVRRENSRLGTGYEQSLEESQAIYQLIDAVFMICGNLTLRNFVSTFPVTKDFDGAKWDSKDYFYTMDVLSIMNWDEQIGRDHLSDLLWDYQNDELRHAYIEFTGAMSEIYRSQTGKGIMEQFCENNGIGSFTVDKELGIIRDNQTGEIEKINKKLSHLHTVK